MNRPPGPSRYHHRYANGCGAHLFLEAGSSRNSSARLAPPAGNLGTFLGGIQKAYPSIYNNFFTGLPYLLTIIVLAGVVGRSIPPAADGRPYEKESTA